ncbi:glutamine amidotransferase [Ruminococcus sp. YE71]|uniref:class II glutamine amidotransferase n=1 Tax=unclassified Ruminococcus TaxID=2608920 RepID=UPI000885CA2F|nr:MULTISPECIES: class II glutamine amidotransferase [unclassified Ruminococcus]SDA19192.1 glutamine amidotransferase [Ruminococcus sp. YE78]SFW28489.1 glutamine amidotransferase [Ruminococcus sp. YE71]
MCELLGFSGAAPTDLRQYAEVFFSHSETNPHGWGIMYEDGSRHIVKEPVKASDSELLPEVLEELTPQKNMLAHIRYATIGSIKTENCHPFTAADISGRTWTMIHNGTIYSGERTYKYLREQRGDTDSERLFLAFIDMMNEKLASGKLSERERFAAVNGFITENSPRNKLNLMIFDGDLMYIHKNLKNTLSYKKLENGLLFSTTPLDGDGWIPFPIAQVTAFRNGKAVYRGTVHKGVFVPNLEYITALDAMNI